MNDDLTETGPDLAIADARAETFDPRLHLQLPSWAPAMFDLCDYDIEILPTGRLVLDGKCSPLYVVSGSSAVTNGANRQSRRKARR